MAVDEDLRKIMEIVDKNKLNFSNGDYVDVCHSIKVIHVKLNETRIGKIESPIRKFIALIMVGKGLLNLLRP